MVHMLQGKSQKQKKKKKKDSLRLLQEEDITDTVKSQE